MTAKPPKQQPISAMSTACAFTSISHLNKTTQLNQSFSNILLQADLAAVRYRPAWLLILVLGFLILSFHV